jgi:hypothetical protein
MVGAANSSLRSRQLRKQVDAWFSFLKVADLMEGGWGERATGKPLSSSFAPVRGRFDRMEN